MTLKNKPVVFVISLALLICSAACQTATEPKTANANASLVNSNNQATTSAPQPEATKSEPAADVVSLTTPSETYKTGYAARQKKDLATLKRVLSKDAIEFLTEIGKEEEKSLDDQLRALAERPQGASNETRNEKINGNRASLEYLDEKGKWVTMEFAKEDNEWKIDLPKAP